MSPFLCAEGLHPIREWIFRHDQKPSNLKVTVGVAHSIESTVRDSFRYTISN